MPFVLDLPEDDSHGEFSLVTCKGLIQGRDQYTRYSPLALISENQICNLN